MPSMSRSDCLSCAPRPIMAPPSTSPEPARADPTSLIAALRLAARLAAKASQPGPARCIVTETPDSLPPLREVIRRHGLVARKSLGQNFLFDLNLDRAHRARGRTARRAYRARSRPRTGRADPRAAGARRGTRVIAVERDERAIAALQEIAALYPGRLEIVAADALRFDPQAATSRRPGRASSPTCPTTSRPPC